MSQAEKIKNILADTLEQGLEDDEEPNELITELLESLRPEQLAVAIRYLATEHAEAYFRVMSQHEKAVSAIFYGAGHDLCD